ncbi:MAG: cytochrome c3 family protein [Acidobacteriia bacterium]|nr:cytochrome c3 family protein [Terriglobia bacterium]
MAQIFHRSTNVLSRLSIFGFVFILAGIVWIAYIVNRSPYITEVGMAQVQPVPFSHKHHVSGLGLDCRFCHTSVETSAFAGMPPTETCMTCHSQIWSDSPMLEPVRESYRSNQSIEWNRVYQLPGYVYFDHSIHINKGIGCSTCHGRVDQMPLMWRASPMQMEWCLNCHRNVEQYVRPRAAVYQMDYQPPKDQVALGEKLVKEYKVQKLTDCYTCHR